MPSKIPPVVQWGKSIEQLNRVIDNWIFDETHREIVKRRMFNKEDFCTIAESVKLSDERVRQIYYDERRVVFSHKDY